MGTIAQYMVLPVVWLLTRLSGNKVEFRNEDNFAKIMGRPAILVANHICSYDSFLLRLSKYWTKLHVYFMGVKSFNSLRLRFLAKIGVISIVYKLFGVFTVEPGLGIDKNLEAFKKVLAAGNDVFIFPEGSMNPHGPLLPFKKGAAVLAASTGAPILPIGFKVAGKRTIVTVGEPISFPQGSDPESMTARLRDTIARLCE